MKEIALLSAVDRQWGIGCHNELLFHLSKDMEMFRKRTIHQIVIMGRKTLESLPGGKPLPNRKNIVLSRKKGCHNLYESQEDGVSVFQSVREALDYVKDETKEVFVIGGAEIYRQFLPFSTTAYITEIDAQRQADCFFPDLRKDSRWIRVSESRIHKDQSGVEFRFVKYRRVGAAADFRADCL